MKNPCRQLKFIVLILLVVAPTPLESQFRSMMDWYNWIQFLRNPASEHAQKMLEFRYTGLLHSVFLFNMDKYLRLNITNIGHMYLVKMLFDKYRREFPPLTSRLLLPNGYHSLCSLLKHRFEDAREFSAEREANRMEIDCSGNSAEVEQYLERFEEAIQEANFLIFSQFIFKTASQMQMRLFEISQKSILIGKLREHMRHDFQQLFGFARLTQLREMYPHYFSRILELDNETLLRWSYLHYFLAKTMLARWRNKQAAEYFLYLEWEATNSEEQPANGWTASTLWKPFFQNYWEGEHFLRQFVSRSPEIQKEGWERIFLFPEEYAREQLEHPSTLETARVCTLETQREYYAEIADEHNDSEIYETKTTDKFWHECLRSRLKKAHKTENMRDLKKMHAGKLVDLLAFHVQKEELKKAIDGMEEKWLKDLIGMSRKQFYRRVKQTLDSRSGKEHKAKEGNKIESSSSATNSGAIQKALFVEKSEVIENESENAIFNASEIHEKSKKQHTDHALGRQNATNEADDQQQFILEEEREFGSGNESKSKEKKKQKAQQSEVDKAEDQVEIKRVISPEITATELTAAELSFIKNILSSSAKKSPTKAVAELRARSQQKFVEANKKVAAANVTKKPTKKTAFASQEGVDAVVDAEEKKIITVEEAEKETLSMADELHKTLDHQEEMFANDFDIKELYELSKAYYLEQTPAEHDALSAADQIGSQPSLVTSPFPSNQSSSSGALTPLSAHQPSPRTTMQSSSAEDLSSAGAATPPLNAPPSPNHSMPGTPASDQPSPRRGIPPWEPPAKLLLPHVLPSSSGTGTPTLPLSADESSPPSGLASSVQQQLTTTPTSNFEDYLEKIYALFFEQNVLGKGHHRHLLFFLHICVMTRAIDGKFRAALALYRAGIFGEVDEAKTTLKELDSSWRRFKRMAIFGAKIRTDMPLKQATLELETLLGKMAHFYFAMGKMPMGLPSREEVEVVKTMAKGMETPIEKKRSMGDADSVAEKLGLTLTHLHFQFFSLIIARKTNFLNMDDDQAQQTSPFECFGCIDKFTDQEGYIKLIFFRHLHELMDLGEEEQVGGIAFLETMEKLEANIKTFRAVLRQQELDRCMEKELKNLRNAGKLTVNFENKKWINPEFYEHSKAQDFLTENIFMKKREENLITFLEEKYKIDVNTEKQKEEAKSWLAQQVKVWLTKVSALNGKGYGDFTLIVGGSSLLGTDSSNSDLDIIIMLPRLSIDESTREEPTKACFKNDHIFGKNEHSLYSHLLESLKKEEHNSHFYLNAIPSAWVPLIELHRRGIEIDLMVALTPFEVIQPNWSLENTDDDPLMVGYNLTLLDWWIKTMIVIGMERYLKSIRILNGYRIAYRVKYFLLDSQRESCTNLMRAIKLWAKERHIYSNVFGYLSGTIVTILSTKICMVYQSQNLTKLLERFFYMYINWGWPRPVLLEPLTDASQADLLKPIGAWQPIRLNPDERTGDEGDAMPVISSLFPEQNTAHNVNRHTLQIIQKEMRRAYDILNSASKKDLVSVRALFKELDYRKEFNHFFLVLCLVEKDAGTNADSTCGYLKTRIRPELASWAQTATIGKIMLKDHLREYHTLSGFEEKGYCQVDSGKKLCTVWLVGLNFVDQGLDEKEQEIFANNFNYYLAKYDRKQHKLKAIFVKQANIGLDEKLQEILTKADDSGNDKMDDETNQQEHNQFLSDDFVINDAQPPNSPMMDQQHPQQQWLLTPAQQHQLLALYERQFAFYQHQLYLQEMMFLEELRQQDQQNLLQQFMQRSQQNQQYIMPPPGHGFVQPSLYPVIYYNLPMPQPPPLNNSGRRQKKYYVPKNGVKSRRRVPKSQVPNQPQPSH